ncbi:MAG: hypothetical protein ACLRVT_09715 [Oscillospiraceae bacterium]
MIVSAVSSRGFPCSVPGSGDRAGEFCRPGYGALILYDSAYSACTG